MRTPYSDRARGFTLVEVMVAVLVICVGMLGIAKMQALALNNMSTSRLRSLAAIEAASLAAAMHSNRNYWGSPPTTVAIAQTTEVLSSTDTTLSALAIADMGTNPVNACVGTSNGVAVCPTAVNLAAYDLALWAQDLEGLLPNAGANIACLPGPPPSCTIQITWTEQAVAVNAAEGAQQSAAQTAGTVGQQMFENPTYTLYVEP